MLYIRTDMNQTIATGHVMRCLSIAEAARNMGQDTVFILADEQAVGLLKERGYAYIVLHTPWDDMDRELPELEKCIKEQKIWRILIDSYHVTEFYLKRLSEMVKTYYIDDINAFFYPVSGIICYANYQEKFCYPKRYPNAELYLGPKYVPLRKEFHNCMAKHIKPEAEHLLLMSGGSDPYGVLENILDRLNKNLFQRVDVICGMYYPDYDRLKEKYRSYENIRLHKAVTDPDVYMKEADLAVSAGGTTLYELCAAGTPAISYAVADNQLWNVKKFDEDGLIAYAGDVRKEGVTESLVCLIEKYRQDADLRAERSEKMQKLIDGRGAERIAEIFSREEETE